MEPQETEPFASTQEQGGAAEPLRTLIDRLEADERWDPLADTLDDLGRPLAEGPSGPLMRGEWLGHALHPLMTDIPIGCWSSASVLDLIGGRAARPAARRLVGLGVLAALPTAATGLVELASVEDRRLRRVGAVHASGNVVALGMYLMSWRARRRDRHLRGAVLALAGGSLATFTGFLGGHLSFGRGVGVEPRGIDDLEPEGTEATSHQGTEREGMGREGMAEAGQRAAQPSGSVTGPGTADLLGVEQAARELTVPVEQVHTMVEEGLLPAARNDPLGFRPEDVAAVRLQGG
ncbi:MAG TPA: DUF2231 domain-containing protein [Microthrixaceae bacterium]|nr:DUF2231 domain-containing protein [Microthrixaceae bacterium]